MVVLLFSSQRWTHKQTVGATSIPIKLNAMHANGFHTIPTPLTNHMLAAWRTHKLKVLLVSLSCALLAAALLHRPSVQDRSIRLYRRASISRPTFQDPSDAVASCQTTTKYIPSELEQAWLDNVSTWQDDFCSVVKTPNQTAAALAWLQALQEQLYSPSTAAAGSGQFDPKVFSRFVTTSTCSKNGTPKTQETVTWIEPLSHGLRHPHAHCDMKPSVSVMDIAYLLPASGGDVAALAAASGTSCTGRTCQALYFDLGATVWDSSDNVAGQGWFVRSYQRRGIEFDRLLLWEAIPQAPATIYSQLPKELLYKYTYFNIPATTDLSDPSHPLRMLKALAQPGDFVVFKLDIDNAAAEAAIMQAIVEDPAALGLIDEFYFEYHVHFEPMLEYWTSQASNTKTLADAYSLFYDLRRSGVRAHSWV